MVYHDRADAGRRLAARLAHYKGKEAVVFALPRGGVPVAAPIAAMLPAPLDLKGSRQSGVRVSPQLRPLRRVQDPNGFAIQKRLSILKAPRIKIAPRLRDPVPEVGR